MDRVHVSTVSELRMLIQNTIAVHGPACSLNHLDVSRMTSLELVFSNTSFVGDISEWDVSNVTAMTEMFYNCPFNGDISNWDTSRVEGMANMFQRSAFTGDISRWNTARVDNFMQMFDLSAFAGDIGAWTFSDNVRIGGMFGRDNAARLTEPNFFVWVALLEGTDYALPRSWQEHVLRLGPVVQSLQLPLGEGARMLQRLWSHPPEVQSNLALPLDLFDTTSA